MEKEKLKPPITIKDTKIIEIEVEKSQLELLKDSYAVLEEEYSLPKYEEMDKDFSIEKIKEEETDYLIREVRRLMFEKTNGYLRLVETLINPSNAQSFVFIMLKSITNEENKKLKNIYKKLAEKEIDVIELDLEFNLKKEIEFIKNTFFMWQEIKKDMLVLIRKIKKDWNKNSKINEKTKSIDYFG